MTAPYESDPTEPISLSQGFEESPVEAVVTTVAEATGQSPLEMEPLQEVMDPDALNKLFDGQEDRSSSMTVNFDYCGQQVTMTADCIQVDPSDPAQN